MMGEAVRDGPFLIDVQCFDWLLQLRGRPQGLHKFVREKTPGVSSSGVSGDDERSLLFDYSVNIFLW